MHDCTVCGYPTYRRGGHAEWCERIRAYLAETNRSYDECRVDGCDRPHHARGFCAMHYGRWHKAGGLAALPAS